MTSATTSRPSLGIVGGCGSSGSTLLAHLLSRHPAISSGPEFNCFNRPELYDINKLRQAREAILAGRAEPDGYIDVPVFMQPREHYGVDETMIREWLSSSNTTVEFVSQLVDHLRARFGGDIFVEKSPTNVYCLKRASETLPNTPTVHLIRDGRDVAVSLMSRGFNLFSAGSRWLFDTVRGLSARSRPRHLEIRYEDLVKDPSGTLAALFRHFQVSDAIDVLSTEATEKKGLYTETWTRKEPSAWQQTPGDPISAKSVGRHKQVLSQSDLTLLYRIKLTSPERTDLPSTFGELLEFLGYEASNIDPVRPPLRRVLAEEGGDYWRRFQRLARRGQTRLPVRYTRIG